MSRSLLIVEEDSDQLALFERWFIRAGYQVVGVSHSRHALAASTLRSFDVAIISHNPPEMNGIELMHQLRLQLGSLQVVILSCDPHSVSEAEAAGAYAGLVKPFKKSLLEATVKNALEQSETEQPSLSGRNP
jgi:DNA-binding NtrC family response regulator